MPFKSSAQRKWMYMNDPEMAKQWSKQTPKGKNLPDRVKEDDGASSGHDSFEVEEFLTDVDPLDIREMPHVDADIDLGGKHMQIIDLRIERYPIPQSEKQRLMRAFTKTGVVGEFQGELLHFKPDHTIEVLEPSIAAQLPRLPNGWDKQMQFVSEASENDGTVPDEDENGHLPDPEELGREFQKVATTYAVQMDKPFTVKTIEGDADAKEGDFLCKGDEGDMWPVDQEIFLKTYRPVEGPKLEKVFKRK